MRRAIHRLRNGSKLGATAAAKVLTALERMEHANLSNVKGLGGTGGMSEYRIDSGPGYRIYLGRDGDRLIILVGGGTKKDQQADIRRATGFWKDYKRRKRSGAR